MKLTRRDVLVVALSAAFAGSAWAHGPSRQKVEMTVDIAATAAKVWARVANFQDMSWLPVVARTEGQGGNEVGAFRAFEDNLPAVGVANALVKGWGWPG